LERLPRHCNITDNNHKGRRTPIYYSPAGDRDNHDQCPPIFRALLRRAPLGPRGGTADFDADGIADFDADGTADGNADGTADGNADGIADFDADGTSDLTSDRTANFAADDKCPHDRKANSDRKAR
jgi:hypothetical protein